MTGATRVGVIGLARSGRSAAKLALATGSAVFASDIGDAPGLRDAAAEIRRLGGDVEVGGHSIERLAGCDLIVVSPGVPPDAPILTEARLAHIPWISELEYGYRHLEGPVIAVTGTNGKTTVTSWIAHLLREAGTDAVAAGNIGVPLSEIPLRAERPEWVVVEASSYQLGRVDTFRPEVGVVTNLAPDHLDRYPDVASYYADKAHLFDRAGPESAWVLNGDDPDVLALAGEAPGRRALFRARRAPDGEAGAWLDGSRLMIRLDGDEQLLVQDAEIKLLGAHNRANAMAAALAAGMATAGIDALRRGLRSFRPLRHRLEPVGEVEGVLFVNDSKATNVASARVALASMTRPTVLLLGGRPKGESFGALVEAGGASLRAVVAYGEAADRIEAELGDRVRVVRGSDPFPSVVARAWGLAEPGDAVLLSPACASFDMFSDYEDRGRRFIEAVERLRAGTREAARE